MDRWVLRIDSLIRFFFYVLIFWIPYSPAVIEICVTASVVLWIIKRYLIFYTHSKSLPFRKKLPVLFASFHFAASPINSAIYFFLFACILSATSSIFALDSTVAFFTKTMEWFIIYFMVIEVFTSPAHILTAVSIFVFTTVSTAIDGLIQYYITSRDFFLGHTIEPHSRATAGFKTPNDLGGYFSLAIPVFFALILMSFPRRWIRPVLIAFFLIISWALIMTFTRAAWIGVFLGILFFLLFINYFKKKSFIEKYSFFIRGFVFFMAVSLIIGWLSLNVIIPERKSSISWRKTIWTHSLTMISEKPIFGHGINTYMTIFQAYYPQAKDRPTYAHNCFLQIAAETGILGLTFFLLILYRIAKSSILTLTYPYHTDKNYPMLGFGILAGLIAFIFHSSSDTNLYSLQLSAYFWTMTALLFCVNNVFKIQGFHAISEHKNNRKAYEKT